MKEKARKKHPSKRIALIGLGLLVVLGIGAYLGRGWLRSDFVSFYTTTFYLSDLHHHYTKSFEPVNNELAKFGFSFNKMDTNECYEPQYQGLGVSTSCEQGTVSNKLVPTELQPKWHAGSEQFEKFLYSQGWSKDNKGSDIPTLFDNVDTNQHYQEGIGYRKTFGALTCNLSLRNSPDSHEAYVVESCYRDIKFFGGY